MKELLLISFFDRPGSWDITPSTYSEILHTLPPHRLELISEFVPVSASRDGRGRDTRRPGVRTHSAPGRRELFEAMSVPAASAFAPRSHPVSIASTS